jgi:Nuclease A inhibitor-like protein
MPSPNPAIAAAAAGLLVMSESDYPLEFFALEEPANAQPPVAVLLRQLGKPAGTPVEQQALSYFLRNLTRESADYTPERNETARRFQHLQAVLNQELQEVSVYRIGQVQIQAFILGRDAEGFWSGLKTTQIET